MLEWPWIGPMKAVAVGEGKGLGVNKNAWSVGRCVDNHLLVLRNSS